MAKKSRISKGSQIVSLSAFLLAGAAAPTPVMAATLSCPVSLILGMYTICGVANTATVTPQNTRSTTGCLSAGPAPFNRGQCNVNQGFPPTNYQISVTAAQYTISNGTDDMVVDDFQCRFQGSAGTVTGNCIHSTSGFFLLMDIGATLNIGNSQGGGTYSGTFTINANFP